ncbi:hypothetical protein ACRALDRAFT_205431 [Sodiomyces alcalophilus JCM 7366]|uniref:uncharacterized protein n=1 Tax=Sodiomyces alcalophilus JCM 7366 TaxID=591952 RepID=UPI0039B3DC7D
MTPGISCRNEEFFLVQSLLGYLSSLQTYARIYLLQSQEAIENASCMPATRKINTAKRLNDGSIHQQRHMTHEVHTLRQEVQENQDTSCKLEGADLRLLVWMREESRESRLVAPDQFGGNNEPAFATICFLLTLRPLHSTTYRLLEQDDASFQDTIHMRSVWMATATHLAADGLVRRITAAPRRRRVAAIFYPSTLLIKTSTMMDWYERVRTRVLAWTHDTPLPRGDTEARVVFQSWHHVDRDSQQWVVSLPGADTTTGDNGFQDGDHDAPPRLTLLTWNIDGMSPKAEDRVAEIVGHITQQSPPVDIIFLQEVSRPALHQILDDERVRRSWFSSECDDRAWSTQFIATVTLLSRQRFAPMGSGTKTGRARLGRVWRVPYPSRYDRDALCCDIFVPSPDSPRSLTRTRLINVHLDSLAIHPSHRPQQMSIISRFLRSAGRGVVAGDFNPVLEEDATLVEGNGLTDAWTALHPEQPGYTWGTDGKQSFPPARLDKVALLGLRPYEIRVVESQRLGSLWFESQGVENPGNTRPWSDHHALLCSFAPIHSAQLVETTPYEHWFYSSRTLDICKTKNASWTWTRAE